MKLWNILSSIFNKCIATILMAVLIALDYMFIMVPCKDCDSTLFSLALLITFVCANMIISMLIYMLIKG